MIDKCLELLGINTDATLNDVKKAYRRHAKENHPDRFVNVEQKKKQEIKMVKINDAYQIILSNIDNLALKTDLLKSVKEKPSNIEADYMLYKKGIDYFNAYNGNFSKKENQILEFELETLLEKKDILEKAKTYFLKILQDFPESDWAFDSEDRIKKIDKFINHLDNRISDINNHSPYWTEKGTPYSKKNKDL
jgi:curved DNA-binding protein CbpA